MNFFKTVFLLSLLSILFVYVGRAFGGQTGMTIALVLVLAMNFFSYWFSDKIVLREFATRSNEWPIGDRSSFRYFSISCQLALKIISLFIVFSLFQNIILSEIYRTTKNNLMQTRCLISPADSLKLYLPSKLKVFDSSRL